MTIYPPESRKDKKKKKVTAFLPWVHQHLPSPNASISCEPAPTPTRAMNAYVLKLLSASQWPHVIDAFPFTSLFFAVIVGIFATPFLLKCNLHYMLGHLLPDLQSISLAYPSQSLLPFSLLSHPLPVVFQKPILCLLPALSRPVSSVPLAAQRRAITV